MTSIDEPPFVYSLRRLQPESYFVEQFELGSDSDATVSLIRAAIESRQALPPGIFDGASERLLIDFLCGDPVDSDLSKSMWRKHKPSLWICRGRSCITGKVPLIGLTQRAFEALLYQSRRLASQPHGMTERLDGALLFTIGFSISHIEKNTIPF
jgi:hypothetical protein